MKFDPQSFTRLFANLSRSVRFLVFEMVAKSDAISIQFATTEADLGFVRTQLESFFPEAVFVPAEGRLAGAWGEAGAREVAVVEFGLGKEFVLPLDPGSKDPFVGLVGALSGVGEGETAVFQAMFSPASPRWNDEIVSSVTHADGSALFVNAPELLPAAKAKASEPLFAAVVRVGVATGSRDRSWAIACDMGAALGVYGSMRGNELVPLKNEGYPPEEHELDFLSRLSRRSGMLLGASELAGFVHLPGAEVRSPKLRRAFIGTKAAPEHVRGPAGLRLGTNSHAGKEVAAHLTHAERVRHTHIIGASGTAKSSLLYNLIMQDVERGEGLTLLDPHGDLCDRVLGSIPVGRLKDVVIVDPSDEAYSVGFNVLDAHSDWEKNLLAADLVAVFRRNSTAWGDQLNSVLSNALLAFMESDRGGTLLDVRRFLLEPTFRESFLGSVRDPNIVYYWRKAFPSLSGNKSIGPVITRLDAFLSPRPVRYMVGQRHNRIDFGEIMDSGKILIVKLSEGAIGKDNSHLLGSIIIAKIQAEAMARQRQSEASRRHHFLYVDEFHSFLTPSLAECLSGVRKYRVGLVLAHQEMRQVERDQDVASAVLNAYTRIVFRVNDRDARVLESGFSAFSAADLQNLPTGHAVCRVERRDFDFNLKVDMPAYPTEAEATERKHVIIALSRERYGTPRALVEASLGVVEITPPTPPPAEDPKKAQEAKAPPPKIEETPAHSTPREAEPRALSDAGKGGAQHKAIQDRIKEEAEKLGFRVTLEKPVLGGAGQVDLALYRDGMSLACEVTVTTSIDHEVGNVSKCIRSGFDRVVMVAVNEEKLTKLSSAVLNSLGAEVASRVDYHLPDGLIGWLRELPAKAPEPVQTEVRTRGGRTVKRTYTAVSEAEAKAKETEALAVMAELMRRKKRPA